MNMNKITIGLLSLGLALMTGCSLLTKQETTQSNIPSAANLTSMCKAGLAQTPPIRAGACDDFDLVQSACIAAASQPLIPANALQACVAGGYVISGSWTPL